jgi:predicted ATP-grasp superfamily ATP-dependent carboligase
VAELGPAPDAPGFVLTTASALGTLAAVRCLGARGVPVFVLDAQRFAPALWSRYVVHREACPAGRPISRFIDALLAFGARHPGHVLYPTSDDLAWAFAEQEATLSKFFRLFTPSFSAVARVLDKRALYSACAEVGLGTPNTWFPETDAEVDDAARRARFPIIIKPRAQVFFTSARKGVCLRSAGELGPKYAAFVRDNTYERTMMIARPDLARPMIQELHETDPIYGVSGFFEPRQKLFVARAARKVLQWPRRAGVGIAFEDAPVEASLADGVRRLCELTGFFGVFEAEFVRTQDGMKLIDFNPRLFNQIGFDVARGLPSPYFAYLAATGESARLEGAMASAQDWRPNGPVVFEHRAMIAWTRAAERVAGRTPEPIPFEEKKKAHKGASPFTVVDAAAHDEDWVPGVVDGVLQVGSALQHPRSALRAAARGHG